MRQNIKKYIKKKKIPCVAQQRHRPHKPYLACKHVFEKKEEI